MVSMVFPPVEIPRELGDWINRHLPAEATWELHPVFARIPPFRIVAYDVIVTGDHPPAAARAPTLEEAIRKAVQRYGQVDVGATP